MSSPTRFDRGYHRWVFLFSAAVLVVGGAVPVLEIASVEASAVAVAAVGAVGLTALFILAARLTERVGHAIPHLLTVLRGIAGTLLLVSVAFIDAPSHRALWAILIILAVVETSDFFDGRTARRFGTAPFGAVWDMENDAFFTFALSFTVWGLLNFPVYVLLIGWFRYLYFFLAGFTGDPPNHPKAYKLFAKTVAATLVITLIAAFAPILPRVLRVTAVTVALAAQIVSFGWDFALHRLAARRSAEAPDVY